MKKDNKAVSKHLGKVSSYKSQYDASLLVREPRQSNRTYLGIDDDDLPFGGTDTWNAYEVSGLTDNGLPVTGIAKIVYSCYSKFIVESKSLKLYLNTFNMTPLGRGESEVLAEIENRMITDLSKLLEVNVEVCIACNEEVSGSLITSSTEWGTNNGSNRRYNNSKFITIENTYPIKDTDFKVYTESPELLRVVESVVPVSHYHSALLKSNCRVTQQPDWGDVFISIGGENTIDPISLLQYIVSFRDECHFHEEIVECIYKRLWDIVKPDTLHVYALYARRGGIDINPERYSDKNLKHYALSDAYLTHIKTPKQ
jgi:7-cyano-7-deazaguanine reductase